LLEMIFFFLCAFPIFSVLMKLPVMNFFVWWDGDESDILDGGQKVMLVVEVVGDHGGERMMVEDSV